MDNSAVVVLTTVPNATEAEQLARKIVEAKLAACVQVLPAIKSIYVWENAIQTEAETLLLIKTLETKYAALETFMREHHSYDVPEIIALSAEKISKSYLGWMTENLA